MPVQDIQIRMEGDPGYKPDSTIPAGTIFSALNPRALQRDPLREAYNNQDAAEVVRINARMLTCSKCGQRVIPGDTRCSRCGRRLMWNLRGGTT